MLRVWPGCLVLLAFGNAALWAQPEPSPPEMREDAELSSVFFLDPHVCLKCHYRSTDLLWQCPHCHEWNSFVEERIAPAKEATVEM